MPLFESVVAVLIAAAKVAAVVTVVFVTVKTTKMAYRYMLTSPSSAHPAGSQINSFLHTANKITYDERDRIRLTNTNCSLFKGKFEGNVKVAIKKIKIPANGKTRIKSDLESLQQRLRRVVDINHGLLQEQSISNIVRFICYDFEAEGDKLHLLMALELCDCNLDEFIQSRQSYQQISNSSIILQLIHGLHHLHSMHIVHRDLKPSNILIKQNRNGDLVFKLSDFGLSKLNTLTNNGIPSEQSFLSDEYGTVHWIPPEIFALREQSVPNPDKSYWKRSDIFPMGLIFYYIATDGQYVYHSQDDIQSGNADFTHVSGNDPLLQLLRHMLAPKPKDRPFTEHIIKHPALWSTEKTLDFFDNSSNLLMDRTLSLACPIEQNAVNVLGGDWRVHLTPAVENYLFPLTGARNRSIKSKNQPSYDKTSVQSLLRVIRNNKGHYYQLTLSVQTELGNFPDGYLSYWTGRFPQLLMHTYDVMNVHSTQPSMSKFYV